jgi:hypothetical protein
MFSENIGFSKRFDTERNENPRTVIIIFLLFAQQPDPVFLAQKVLK